MDGFQFEIKTPEMFNLDLMLDCGQAFRWEKDENGNMRGVVSGKQYTLRQDGDTLYCSCTEADFNKTLRRYLDFDRDYKTITDNFGTDENLKMACEEYAGIRILRQEPWETLCSFIISQNNNIPRIKGIISRLCESFGEQIEENAYSFPSAERLSTLTVEDLSPLRAGFRAKYILDAAQRVSKGEVDFARIDSQPTQYGREELVKIKGVGKKVAECTLLYGFGKLDAFPVDVWVKRITEEMYPNGLPECMKKYEGIAQQYLFHWRRSSERFKNI